jgi:acetyl esterase
MTLDLHPDCLAYLEELRALAMPASTAEEVRARYRFLCTRYAGERVEVAVRDAGGRAPLRVYGEGGGVLLWFHGGRMVSGDLETHDSLCRRLARSLRGRVVAVDYRLAPEHLDPAQTEDARWALEAVRSLGGKLAVGGDSAGAWLALEAALEEPAGIESLVLAYPMIDAACGLASHGEFEAGPGTSGRDIRLGYEWWLGGRRRESPLRAEGFEKLPRTYVLTCGVDPLRDEGLELGRRLKAAGVAVVERHYAGHLHGFLTYPARFSAAEEVVEEVAGFVAGR